MVAAARPAIEMLRESIDGSIITVESPGYDEARKAWNADIDRRPAVIVRCASGGDVAAAVLFAREAGLEIAIRGGAHSFPGHSVCDDGLVIDLSRMKAVVVDPGAKLARVQGGALLRDLDAATQAHGLAVPAGIVGHTGVGGLTLGGGMGWLTRQAGLSIDNLESAEVVVADGRVLRASQDENSDLFWAIRGGGGNFGVVTEFEFRLHEVGPMVQVGLFFWGQEDGKAALRLMRTVIGELPRSMNALAIAAITAAPAPFVPVEHQGKICYALVLTGFGDSGEHQKIVDHIRSVQPPLFDFVTPMPYLALQQMLDEPNAWGFYGYDKGAYLEELTDEVIDVLTERGPEKNSPLSLLIFYRLDEAYSEVGEDETAYGGGRSPRYFGTFVGLCPTPELLGPERAWVRSVYDALRPHLLTSGTYVNVLVEEDDSRIRESYGAKYDRLREIKGKYDPENVFHRNANIKPAEASRPALAG
ncbi:FAD-binding oxidoreductase [Micromonospora sp. DT81.3]|uniref:FAD-binding oxidoreductase n=1 Tax=Actinomycetes TaxID=1760 RepID=UPI003CF05F35